jgi:hypothetical protein
MIRRNTGSTPPATPSAGALVTDLATPATTFTDNGLTPGSTYSYSLFAHTASPSYSTGTSVTTTTTTPCTPSIQDVSGIIASNTTWSPTCVTAYVVDGPLDVPAGVTLTLQPGVVVKSELGSSPAECSSCSMSVEGSLVAVGTAAAPIIFTSIFDTTIGGDTAIGDSADGSPSAGNWNGIYADGGSIDIEHAAIRYDGSIGGTNMTALTAISDTFASGSGAAELIGEATTATVKNNTFSAPSNLAAMVSSPQLVFSGNTATGIVTWPAFWADSSALNFTTLSTNTANAGGLAVSGTATTSTWSGTIALVLESGDGGYEGYFATADHLDVPTGTTLTVAAGSVVKSVGYSEDAACQVCSMSVEGSLVAVGTAAAPIIFTSIFDTTIGGDTAIGDSADGSPSAGNWNGIYLDPTNTSDNISNVLFEYASDAIDIGLLDSLTVTDSKFEHNQAAFEVASTTNNDPALGSLECVPPYLSFIDATTDWFGSTGIPGADIDLLSFLGLTVPDSVSSLYGALSGLTSADVGISDNTIPWTLYSCAPLAIPPFPVTPVNFSLDPTNPFSEGGP